MAAVLAVRVQHRPDAREWGRDQAPSAPGTHARSSRDHARPGRGDLRVLELVVASAEQPARAQLLLHARHQQSGRQRRRPSTNGSQTSSMASGTTRRHSCRFSRSRRMRRCIGPGERRRGSVPLSVTLRWEGGYWAHKYDIYFGTSPTPPLAVSDVMVGSPQTRHGGEL